MRTASKLLSETSPVSDRCAHVPETAKIPVPMMTEPMNDGLVVVDDGLIENPIAAPELLARVRASLRAMKITRIKRSRFDAQ
jgi:hypothetical protein